MNLLHNDSPAGRAIELVNDLVKQGRMSQAEARVIEDLVWNPEFPQSLRGGLRITNTVTVTVGSPAYPFPGAAGDVPLAPPVTSGLNAPKFDTTGTNGRARPKSWFDQDRPHSDADAPMVPRRPVDAAP